MVIQNKDLGKAIVTVAEDNVYNSEKSYERLTFVKYNGKVYLSKQDVPIGISPTGGSDDEYWLDYEISASSVIIGRAYCRTNNKNIAAPTGGSFNNPHPVEDIWKDAPYDGNAILWYSERMFTEDAKNQDESWSKPAPLTYTVYTEFYSSTKKDKPGNPDEEPAAWQKGYVDGLVWIAMQEVYNGVKKGWQVVRIAGTTINKPEATVDANVGIPEVIVTQKGNDLEKTYTFTFKNLKGEHGNSTYAYYGVINKNGNNPISDILKPNNVNVVVGDSLIDMHGDVYAVSVINDTTFKVATYTFSIKGETGNQFKNGITFIRSNNTVETPVGGTFESPIPTTAGWTNHVPDGEAKLWISTRRFGYDENTSDEVWSTPVQLTDNNKIEVLYSSLLEPGNPIDNPENWSANVTNYVYIAFRYINNGVIGDWNIAYIKGDKGDNAKIAAVFMRTNSNSAVVTPTGGNYDNPTPNETQWKTTIPDGTAKLWVSLRMFTNTGVAQDENWSTPVAITYVQYTETKYSSADNNPGTPETNPTNWTDSDTDYNYIAIRQIYNGTKQAWNVSRVKGEPGKNLTVIDYKDSYEQLLTDVPNPKHGDAYGVGTEVPYDLYIYNIHKGWVYNGHVGVEVVDNLDSTAIDSPLSANMGRALNDKINALGSPYKPKGTKNSFNEVVVLTDSKVGDVWNVETEFYINGKKFPAGTNVVCIKDTSISEHTSDNWDPLGGTVDLTPYATNENVDNKLNQKIDKTAIKNDFTGGATNVLSAEQGKYLKETKLDDAPSDDLIYGRKNGQWVEAGDKYIIELPYEIMTLNKNTSSSDEILAAFGGKENYIQLVTNLVDKPAICIVRQSDVNNSSGIIVFDMYCGVLDNSYNIVLFNAGFANSIVAFDYNPITQIASMDGNELYIGEAPKDNNPYMRKNGQWSAYTQIEEVYTFIPTVSNNKITQNDYTKLKAAIIDSKVIMAPENLVIGVTTGNVTQVASHIDDNGSIYLCYNNNAQGNPHLLVLRIWGNSSLNNYLSIEITENRLSLLNEVLTKNNTNAYTPTSDYNPATKKYVDDTKTAIDINISNHTNRTDNPHSVTKSQVGLGNVNNTSDIDKPVSTATQTAINTAKAEVYNDLSNDIANKANFKELTASDDLNNFRSKEAFIAIQQLNINVSTSKHYPVNNEGGMLINCGQVNGASMQIYHTYYYNKIFVRSAGDGNFTAWEELAKKNDIYKLACDYNDEISFVEYCLANYTYTTQSQVDQMLVYMFGSVNNFKDIVSDIQYTLAKYYFSFPNKRVELSNVCVWHESDYYELSFTFVYHINDNTYHKIVSIHYGFGGTYRMTIDDVIKSDNITTLTRKSSSEYASLTKDANTMYAVVD